MYEKRISNLKDIYKRNKDYIEVDEATHTLIVKDKSMLDTLSLNDFTEIVNEVMQVLKIEEKCTGLMAQHFLSISTKEHNRFIKIRENMNDQIDLLGKLKIRSALAKGKKHDCCARIPDPAYFMNKYEEISKSIDKNPNVDKVIKEYAESFVSAIDLSVNSNIEHAKKQNFEYKTPQNTKQNDGKDF